MGQKLLFVCFSFIFSLGHFSQGFAEPVICDPMQSIDINMEIVINDAVMAELTESGVQELSLTPALDFAWTQDFPAVNGTKLTLTDNADPLSINLQDGLLVTYKSCEGDIIYAYCQTTEDLKGEFPKDVKLHLNPALKQCKIEVICTQCP